MQQIECAREVMRVQQRKKAICDRARVIFRQRTAAIGETARKIVNSVWPSVTYDTETIIQATRSDRTRAETNEPTHSPRPQVEHSALVLTEMGNSFLQIDFFLEYQFKFYNVLTINFCQFLGKKSFKGVSVSVHTMQSRIIEQSVMKISFPSVFIYQEREIDFYRGYMRIQLLFILLNSFLKTIYSGLIFGIKSNLKLRA